MAGNYGIGIGQSSTDGMFNPFTANWTGASGPADPNDANLRATMDRLGSLGLGIGSGGVAPLSSLTAQNAPGAPTAPAPVAASQYDALGNPGGSYQGASSAPSTPYSFSQNPYLSGMGSALQQQTQLGLQDAFNQIRSNSVGNGTLGGDRQGIAQGVATGQAMGSLQGQLANLYGGAYENQQNRDLQRYGIDTNFYNTGRALDLQQTMDGAQLYNLGFQGQWSPVQNANGAYQPYSGMGTTTGTTQQGGGMQGAIGGGLGTLGLGSRLGWFGGTPTTNTQAGYYGSYGGYGV